MAATFEREIKLSFDSPQTARAAVLATGMRLRARRLQLDCLLDATDEALLRAQSILRVRAEEGRAVLTFKGPVQPSAMKHRGHREEYAAHGVVIAVDETPVGTYVEIEGSENGVAATARALGRGPGDHITESYRGLYARNCEERGVRVTDTLFDRG